MVTDSVKIALESTVRECLESGRPFSAYNITIWTRDKEKINLRHQDCVGLIHDIDILQDALDYGYIMADSQTYTWVKSKFSKWNGPTFDVYHPVGYDLVNFLPEGVSPADQKAITASVRPASMIGQVTVQDGTHPDAGGNNDDGSYRTDFRNRLLVPTKFLREAGIKAGDEVHVLGDATAEVIWITTDIKAMSNLMQGITIQTVERDGDLRLSSRTLNKVIAKNQFDIKTKENDSKIKVVEIT